MSKLDMTRNKFLLKFISDFVAVVVSSSGRVIYDLTYVLGGAREDLQ